MRRMRPPAKSSTGKSSSLFLIPLAPVWTDEDSGAEVTSDNDSVRG